MILFSLKVLRVTAGVGLVVFGFIALLIPFFPFAWVAFIGLELLGIRLAFWSKIKTWLWSWKR